MNCRFQTECNHAMPATVWNRLVLESVQTVFHMPHFDSVYLKNFRSNFSIIFTENSWNHTYDFSKRIIQIFSFLWEMSALELLNPFFWDTLYMMSLLVDCIFQTSYHKTCVVYGIAVRHGRFMVIYSHRAVEVCNLLGVTSRLILKLDRVWPFG